MKQPKIIKKDKIREISCGDLYDCVNVDGMLYIPLNIHASGKYQEYSVEYDVEYAPYECRSTFQYTIYGHREETDEEYASRMTAHKQLVEQRKKEKLAEKERELKELERLKKKYEN